MSRWISLCCGLDAVSTFAMCERWPPLSRMGGKRGVAKHVLQILGSWPRQWLMIDADPAIVDYWRAAFAGLLPEVAEVIRTAPLDGEELWRAWTAEPVPEDHVERVARWIVLQHGNFRAKPLTFSAESWGGIAGFNPDAGFSISRIQKGHRADAVAATWAGVAGYSHLSKRARQETGFKDAIKKESRADAVASTWVGVAGYGHKSVADQKSSGVLGNVNKDSRAAIVAATSPAAGVAALLDLKTSSPLVRPGDLMTIDPPYSATTPYGPALPRERVVELALEAHRAGARVLVNEQEPVIDAPGWRAVHLRRGHGGKGRTWSKQQDEVATINFQPAQMSLF